MASIIFWAVVFLAALFALVKGADWLIDGAERIGLALGMSSFIIGLAIVSIGTSLPELIASFSALAKGVPSIIPANAIGSNVANVFLVLGITTLVGRQLKVEKDLIDLDIPLLAASTAVFLMVAWDGSVTQPEALILVLNFVVYIIYIARNKNEAALALPEDELEEEKANHPKKLGPRDFGLIVLGVAGLALGANYVVDSVVVFSEMLGISAGVITITAVAIGTSLPELTVSLRALWQDKVEVALGNVFGSNVFNLLMVVGFPGLFAVLPLDEQTFAIGIPVLAAATFLFIISGISRKIHAWEGSFYLSLYILFIAKLFDIF